MRFHIPGLILAAAISFSAADIGGSAVVTLVMPPPGGEGYSALQAGESLPEGAASLYYPALLAELQRSTGSQLFYTHSRQQLLPLINLADLYQDFWSVAGVVADPSGGTDMGVGFFRNKVSFGEIGRRMPMEMRLVFSTPMKPSMVLERE